MVSCYEVHNLRQLREKLGEAMNSGRELAVRMIFNLDIIEFTNGLVGTMIELIRTVISIVEVGTDIVEVG